MLPWTSMEVTPMGTYSPCCIFDGDIPDMSVQQGHTIKDAQSSAYMEALRSEFLAGEKPAECRACWEEESVPGRMSKRKNMFIKMKNLEIDFSKQSYAPKFLDLKLGNICNLKCRICGSWSSSKWAQEEIDVANGENNLAKKHLKDGQWPRISPDWWVALEDALPHIEYLEFTGGEPFLINEHFDLLQLLVDRGYSHKIDIHYNTNGTVWPNRGAELWSQFKHIEIAFSIDDTGKRFEYQRYGSDWKKVEEVVKQAMQTSLLNQNIDLQVCTTFNIQNAYYWAETEDWILKQGIRDIYCNLLREPPEFSLRNLPLQAKNIFEQRMRQASEGSKHKINGVIGFMHLPGQDLSAKLLDRLAANDAYRKQSFADNHSDVWKLLDDK